MEQELINKIDERVGMAVAKYPSESDNTFSALENALCEETGEVAHAINHDEGWTRIQYEIEDAMAVLTRIWGKVADLRYIEERRIK